MVVRGGAGFIGSHLAERLADSGADVVVIDDLSSGSEANAPAGASLLRIDLATAEAVDAIIDAHPDSVIHCAAQTSVPKSFNDPAGDARSNIVGSLMVIEACRRAAVADLMYITTGGALYGRPMVVPWDEQAAVTPISLYGITKWTVGW